VPSGSDEVEANVTTVCWPTAVCWEAMKEAMGRALIVTVC